MSLGELRQYPESNFKLAKLLSNLGIEVRLAKNKV